MYKAGNFTCGVWPASPRPAPGRVTQCFSRQRRNWRFGLPKDAEKDFLVWQGCSQGGEKVLVGKAACREHQSPCCARQEQIYHMRKMWLSDPRQASVSGHHATPPRKRFLFGWAQRRNARLGVKGRRRAELWTEQNFHAFIAATQARAEQPSGRVGPVDQLQPVGFQVLGKSTCAPLVSASLVRETFERLRNPHDVQLCMDGTFR